MMPSTQQFLAAAHFFGLAKPARPAAATRPRRTSGKAGASAMPPSDPGRFAHLRPASSQSAAVPQLPVDTELDFGLPDPDVFAKAMMRTAAKVAGQKFDATTFIAGPRQATRCATGVDILTAARRAGLAR
jgi:hypothetical protein